MAMPSLVCAVIAQILMGTVYVFGVQAVHETLALLSRGNRTVYRKVMYYNRLLWDVAVATTGLVALVVYERVGPTAPFLAVGVMMFIVCLVYILFIIDRFGCHCHIDVDALEKSRLLAMVNNVPPKAPMDVAECGESESESERTRNTDSEITF